MRRRTGQVDGLRATLAERVGAFVARYPRGAGPYHRLLDDLNARLPVEVSGWQIPQAWRAGVDSWDRVRIERDGSMVVLDGTASRVQYRLDDSNKDHD